MPDGFLIFPFLPRMRSSSFAVSSTLIFISPSLFLSIGAACLAAVGCMVLAYEAARRE